MNILEHPIHKDIYDLCQEIEKLPASDQATKVVVMASSLSQPAAKLVGTVRNLEEKLARIYRVATGEDQVAHDNIEGMAWIAEQIVPTIKAPNP